MLQFLTAQYIAAGFQSWRDLMTFKSLCRVTAVAVDAIQVLHVDISPKKLKHPALQQFLEERKQYIKSIVYKRWIYQDDELPFIDAPTLERLCLKFCRVLPRQIATCAAPHLLKTLVLHQLDAGDEPGLKSLLQEFCNLEHLSITFTPNWGIVSLAGLSDLHSLRFLECRRAPCMLVAEALPQNLVSVLFETTRVLLFEDVLPASVKDVTLISSSRIAMQKVFGASVSYCKLKRLYIKSSGMVVPDFISKMPRLSELNVDCDSFLITHDLLAPNLHKISVHVTHCYATEQRVTSMDLVTLVKKARLTREVEAPYFDS
jgi:hypothetical protein